MPRSLLTALAAILVATLQAQAAPGRDATSDPVQDLANNLANNLASNLAAIDARRRGCLDGDPSNAGMKQCSGGAEAAADALLNGAYAAAVAGLKRAGGGDAAETSRRLVASERAWITYRDAQCAFEGSSMLGGTGEDLAIIECRYAMTAARAKAVGAAFEAR